MAKTICAKCWKELGLFSAKIPVSNGAFCKDCLESAGIESFSSSLDTQKALQIIEERSGLRSAFNPTKKISSFLLVDENNNTFKIGPGVYKYSELLSFELLEDGESITKGGLGRAVAGGLLFGGAGAIVGGVTGKKKTKGICTSMQIKVTFRNTAPCDSAYIRIITSDTKVGGLIYNGSKKYAQDCLSALQIIADKAEQASRAANNNPSSAADEILKFKNLFDAGIITEEEFAAKKKQLLGI